MKWFKRAQPTDPLTEIVRTTLRLRGLPECLAEPICRSYFEAHGREVGKEPTIDFMTRAIRQVEKDLDAEYGPSPWRA